jgi:hypothetical protein
MRVMHNMYHNLYGNIGGTLKIVWAVCVLVAYLPEILYEGIITRWKGTPVVISADWMLAELDPMWGFLDLKIENGWKAIEVITGL